MPRRIASERYSDTSHTAPEDLGSGTGNALLDVLTAFHHPTRRWLSELLVVEGPATVGRLSRRTGLAVGSVSHRLGTLHRTEGVAGGGLPSKVLAREPGHEGWEATMILKDALCAVELFCELPDDLVEEMIAHGSTVKAAPGVPIVRQGDPSTGMLMVIRGSAEVDVDGRAVRTLSTGDYFGELSLIDGAERWATLTSGEQGATMFRLSPASVTELIEQHPHTAMLLLKGLGARVRQLEAQLAAA